MCYILEVQKFNGKSEHIGYKKQEAIDYYDKFLNAVIKCTQKLA
jgi:hypothetical protein